MDSATAANAYKNQQIMTAPRETLTLMLYNGAIKFLAQSIRDLEDGNLEQANNHNIRAQDIVREFMNTLDMQYEISHSLFALYEYIEYRLIQGNLKKDKTELEEIREMLIELRDTWQEAMKLARVPVAIGK